MISSAVEFAGLPFLIFRDSQPFRVAKSVAVVVVVVVSEIDNWKTKKEVRVKRKKVEII